MTTACSSITRTPARVAALKVTSSNASRGSVVPKGGRSANWGNGLVRRWFPSRKSAASLMRFGAWDWRSSPRPRRSNTRNATGPTKSPQTLSRGKRSRSTRSTSTPVRASCSATVAPAGPAPATITSASSFGMSRRRICLLYERDARPSHLPRCSPRFE